MVLKSNVVLGCSVLEFKAKVLTRLNRVLLAVLIRYTRKGNVSFSGNNNQLTNNPIAA